MKVTYSGKMDIGAGGIGRTAFHQVKPLYDEKLIDKIYATELIGIPKEKFHKVPQSVGSYEQQDIFFDGYVALNMKSPPEILQSWCSHSLFTMREFPKSIKLINLYSAHISLQKELLQGEMGTNMINPTLEKKIIKEMEIADHILIPSEWIYKSLKKYGLEYKAKIIPFGVDLNKFKPKSDDVEDDKFRVIYVGSNWIRKGLVYLLATWKKLDFKNAELIVAGVDKSVAKYFEDIKNVKWGWVPDLVKSYQNSDVFCLPAIEDGNPLAALEAMSCGLPVIISENMGTYQHVYNGMNGFIVPPKNYIAIAEKLQWLYDNRNQAKRMGANARKVIEAFPWERYEKEYIKFIKELS